MEKRQLSWQKAQRAMIDLIVVYQSMRSSRPARSKLGNQVVFSEEILSASDFFVPVASFLMHS
jgi:hypothetical protein